MDRPIILVTNDDGYQAEGLHHLVEGVRELGEVWVVAPANPKSACGHSLTLTSPLKLIEVGERFYKVEDGTPTDCVFIALAHLFRDRKPDLVVSGINYGANMGEDVTYSGTVGGAMEGSIHQIPSIAFSQVITSFEEEGRGIDWAQSREVAYQVSQGVLEGRIKIPDRQILNVNIPNVREIKGYRVTKGGYRLYRNEVVVNRNPRGELYFWIGLHPLNFREEEGTDFWAIKNGYVSITPLKMDLTALETIPQLADEVESYLNRR